MRVIAAWLVLAAALVGAHVRVVSAASEPPSPRVRIELVSEVQSIAPGETFWVGLRQRIAPGWHTYWMNPGDSGEPPRIEWTLPAGFTDSNTANNSMTVSKWRSQKSVRSRRNAMRRTR